MNKYQLVRQPQVVAFEVNDQGELQSKVLIGQDRLQKEPGKFKNKKPGKDLKKPVWDNAKQDWKEAAK